MLWCHVSDGSVNGGWLGRVCTTLHLHAPYMTRSTSAFFLFALLSFPSVFMYQSRMWYFADMRSVLTDLLRAKYGAAARKCVEADGRFAQAIGLVS